jgi:hypothetical protein
VVARAASSPHFDGRVPPFNGATATSIWGWWMGLGGPVTGFAANNLPLAVRTCLMLKAPGIAAESPLVASVSSGPLFEVVAAN